MYPILCIADLHNMAKELNKEVKFVAFSYLDTACSRQGSDYRLTRQKTIYCFDEHGKFIKTRMDHDNKQSHAYAFKSGNCDRRFKTA